MRSAARLKCLKDKPKVRPSGMVKKAEEREKRQAGRKACMEHLERQGETHTGVRTGTVRIFDEDLHIAMDVNPRGQSRWRRFGTQIMAVAALLLTTVPLALTALIVWRVLGRPLLFRQSRAGLGMRTFTIQKFRTMHDSRDPSGTLLPDRLRETPATRFLRRMRLDELPQLLAILRGDMGFVGPRPLLPATIQEFGELGRLRCRVRPGLTGWAQVNGNSQLTDAQKLALDIWYIDHRSWTLDIFILLSTIVTIVQGERIEPDHVAKAEAHLAGRGDARSTVVRE